MAPISPNIMAAYLRASATRCPDKEAVTFGERRVTWGELAQRSLRLANALVRLGVEPGDRVTFMFHNDPGFVETNYAVQIAGGIPVPLNYRFTAAEVKRQLSHSEARVVIYDGLSGAAVEQAAEDGAARDGRTFMRRGPGDLADALHYDELLESEQPDDPGVATAPEDTAAIIYTGGTTGFPKGVMLSYGAHVEMFANMLAGMLTRGVQLDMSADRLARLAEVSPLKLPFMGVMAPLIQSGPARWLASRPGAVGSLRAGLRRFLSDPRLSRMLKSEPMGYMVPSLPFFHSASYMLLMMGAMTGNLRFILPPAERFDPALVLAEIERERPFLMANVPTGWKKLVRHPDARGRDLSSVRVCISGAGVCPVDLKRRIFDGFPGALIMDMFGQTEMTPVTAFRMDAGPETLKERSVGAPIVQVRVQDEAGNALPPGEVGEILYRSDTMMQGYYQDEGGTSEAMSDGWFRSGDLGYLDEDGEIRVVDRKRECINTGGEKVFPLEVEEALQEHPAVEAACVIGVEDPEWGQRIRAVVQPREGMSAEAAELIAFVKERLAGYKAPREVVFVEALPLSPVGKVLRGTIRERYGAP